VARACTQEDVLLFCTWGATFLDNVLDRPRSFIDAALCGVYVKVAEDCAHGSDVQMEPTNSYTFGAVARAQDGKVAAVQLCPARYVPTRVTATQAGTAAHV
jgi:hypothetical protein